MEQTRIKKRRRDYLVNPDGSKSIPLSPEAKEIIENQFAAFRKKFGREPGPDDPLFFDPDVDEPRQLGEGKVDEYQAGIVKAMQAANLPGELIYAYQKTGRIVMEDNISLLTDKELEEWNAAIEEYRQAPKRS